MKVHGCSGRSPPHYDSDGEESNSSSAGSISVAASPQVNHQIHGGTTTTAISDWYVACQPPPPAPPDPLSGLSHFGNIHHTGATTAY